jgi:hypothetical protein
LNGDDEPTPTLRDLALEAIESLDDVTSAPDADATLFARAGHPFVALTASGLEVRLEPLVATAALRTPDTSESPRGRVWVRFSPAALDRFAADRLIAWIEHAWRHAGD